MISVENKKNIFIQSVFPAPYRTSVFKALSEYYNVFVSFERKSDDNRNSEWFDSGFGFDGVILDNSLDMERFKIEVHNLKKYDAVLAYDYSSLHCIKLMLRCMRLNIPYYINCDGSFPESQKNPVKNMVKRFFIKRARGCFASGTHAKDYFLTFGAREENVFIHNFTTLNDEDILDTSVTVKEKEEIRKKLNLPLDRKIVVSVGQFAYRKGYDILLEAWKNIIDTGAVLYIIGGGEKRQEYLDFIKQEGIDNVKIIDYKPKQEIFEYYKAADFFVLPTREDIWGLVINEAMACGLPIITTNRCVAGLELIEDYKNGFIVPVEDSDALADKIKIFSDNVTLRVEAGQNNLDKIREYTFENVAKAHMQAIEKILNEK
jgi:glycosyltransferase involved in cell wall biosynthesis